MPPPKVSPIAASRAALFDEPPPSRYFPTTPIGRGKNAFGAYVPSAYAAESQAAQDKFFQEQDDAKRRSLENQYRTQEIQSLSKRLPFSTAAAIASARLQEQQAQSNMEVLPFAQEQEIQQSLTGAQRSSIEREQLPQAAELEKAKMQSDLQRLQSENPYLSKFEKMTDNPRHIAAYENFLSQAPADMPERDKQRYAYLNSLQLAQDEEAIRAIEEMRPGTRELNVDDIYDPTTGAYLGSRLKPTVKRSEVAQVLKEYRGKKEQFAADKESRVAEAQARSERGQSIRTLISETNRELSDAIKEDNKERIATLREELAGYKEELKGIAGVGQKAQTVKPGLPSYGQ